MYQYGRAQRFYLAAVAVDLDFHAFSCNAIKVVDYADERCHTSYNELFQPDDARIVGQTAWANGWRADPTEVAPIDGDAEQKQCRILALLFMAAMAETGDL